MYVCTLHARLVVDWLVVGLADSTHNATLRTAGIERIYETFPTICRFRGAGHEADDLRRLMRCYKVRTDGSHDPTPTHRRRPATR